MLDASLGWPFSTQQLRWLLTAQHPTLSHLVRGRWLPFPWTSETQSWKHSDWPCLNHMTTPEPITMAREIIYSTAIINVYWVLSWCLELFKVCGTTPANRRQISTLNRSYILEEHTDNWHINKYILNNLFNLLSIFISALLGLCCWMWDFAGYSNWRLLFLWHMDFSLQWVAFLVAEHRLQTHRLQSCSTRAQ